MFRDIRQECEWGFLWQFLRELKVLQAEKGGVNVTNYGSIFVLGFLIR